MKLGDAHDGPERLLLSDEHAVGHVREHRRLQVEALARDPLAAHHQTCAIADALFDVLHKFV